MQSTRRNLLKALAISPLLTSSAVFGKPPCTKSGHVNIFIHGMFFMEMSKDGNKNLIVYAAPAANHTLWGGVRGNLIKLGKQPINWTTVLEGGSPQTVDSDQIPADVPYSILRFNRSTTQVGNLTGTSSGNIVLPWPKEFVSIRKDTLRNFIPAASSKMPPESQVGQNILNLCSHNPLPQKQIGVVTCLRYCFDLSLPSLQGWTPSINFHFYMEPNLGNDIHHVNVALNDTKKLFEHGDDQFDLQLDESSGNIPTPIETGALPQEIGPEDELAVDEPLVGISQPILVLDTSAKVKNLFAPSLVAPKPSTAPRPGAHHPNEKDDKRGMLFDLTEPNLNPANCPHFFVGG